jgi:hypothetical protein
MVTVSRVSVQWWRDDPSQGRLVPEHVPVSLWPKSKTSHGCYIANGDTTSKNNNKSLKIEDGHKVPKKGEYWLGCNVQGQKILGTKNLFICFNLGTYWPERLIVQSWNDQGRFVWGRIVMPPSTVYWLQSQLCTQSLNCVQSHLSNLIIVSFSDSLGCGPVLLYIPVYNWTEQGGPHLQCWI